jgi:hypothetical protein
MFREAAELLENMVRGQEERPRTQETIGEEGEEEEMEAVARPLFHRRIVEGMEVIIHRGPEGEPVLHRRRLLEVMERLVVAVEEVSAALPLPQEEMEVLERSLT